MATTVRTAQHQHFSLACRFHEPVEQGSGAQLDRQAERLVLDIEKVGNQPVQSLEDRPAGFGVMPVTTHTRRDVVPAVVVVDVDNADWHLTS